jgi:valyl-tRNA synthetase
MGHAMDNVLQDLLIRWHRMQGDATLWMPGTDHAGIATQAVVETRLFELEGKTRHDIGREGLVERIWKWKEEYQARIVGQQQRMGCSCDWDRQRFTMDRSAPGGARGLLPDVRRRADLPRQSPRQLGLPPADGVSDDEVEHETVQGGFWHLRYPVIDPQPGEPEHIVVATTRPETMLGDTAVAVHPDAGQATRGVDRQGARTPEPAPAKEKEGIQNELERLEARVDVLPRLEQLAEMALCGSQDALAADGSRDPADHDEWAKPELGSGCVKITPAHDPNDYDVWQRHPEIGAINILEIDGTLNAHAGPYAGLDRFDARKKVVADLDAQGLLQVRGSRDRARPQRPLQDARRALSQQAVVRGHGRPPGRRRHGARNEEGVYEPGLAQAAIDAVLGPLGEGDWKSPTGRQVRFWPDERYAHGYVAWLAEKRDWCISRQLWWGHRIPIWRKAQNGDQLADLLHTLPQKDPELFVRVTLPSGDSVLAEAAIETASQRPKDEFDILVCLRNEAADARLASELEGLGLVRDPDVLDTWFSSALWPHSTLGWPDPAAAQPGEGQAPFVDGAHNTLDYFYPGSCLVTGRDIITLWVARMVLTGLYNLGDLPFTDVFIHANILDGKGERMSKSKGNGIDPVDIIEQYGADAMRYVLAEMQTGLQDIRLPVQVESPYSGEVLELAQLKGGSSKGVYICPKTKKEFDVTGTRDDLPRSPKVTSDRFEIGRNFCNKLWNASRFALMHLSEGAGGEGVGYRPLTRAELEPEDRWILSRLARATEAVETALRAYNPSAALLAARGFFWDELCDWYLELIKPRMAEGADRGAAPQVLAFALDQVLRLLHPVLPFITEAIWQRLGAEAPRRGIDEELDVSELIVRAPWPQARSADVEEAIEADFALMQQLIRALRDVRAKHEVAPSKPLQAQLILRAAQQERLEPLRERIANLARLESFELGQELPALDKAASQILGDMELRVAGVLDPEKERARLDKQKQNLEKQIRGLQGKLGNANFVQKAPAELVEKERARLAELEDQLGSVEQLLTALG